LEIFGEKKLQASIANSVQCYPKPHVSPISGRGGLLSSKFVPTDDNFYLARLMIQGKCTGAAALGSRAWTL